MRDGLVREFSAFDAVNLSKMNEYGIEAGAVDAKRVGMVTERSDVKCTVDAVEDCESSQTKGS